MGTRTAILTELTTRTPTRPSGNGGRRNGGVALTLCSSSNPTKVSAVSTVQIKGKVTVEELQHALLDELGPHYRVTVDSTSTLKIRRVGMVPTEVTITHHGDTTTFKISTTGQILSRVGHATSINPKVKRALEHAYSEHRRGAATACSSKRAVDAKPAFGDGRDYLNQFSLAMCCYRRPS